MKIVCITFCLLFSCMGFSQSYERQLMLGNRKSYRLFLKNCEAAEEHYSKAIEIDSLYYKAYYLRGKLRKSELYFYPDLAKSDLEKALFLINKEINQSSNGALYRDRGFIKINLGDKEGACDDFNISGDLAKGSYRYYCIEK